MTKKQIIENQIRTDLSDYYFLRDREEAKEMLRRAGIKAKTARISKKRFKEILGELCNSYVKVMFASELV